MRGWVPDERSNTSYDWTEWTDRQAFYRLTVDAGWCVNSHAAADANDVIPSCFSPSAWKQSLKVRAESRLYGHSKMYALVIYFSISNANNRIAVSRRSAVCSRLGPWHHIRAVDNHHKPPSTVSSRTLVLPITSESPFMHSCSVCCFPVRAHPSNIHVTITTSYRSTRYETFGVSICCCLT